MREIGYTVIEMVVVMVIAAILMGIVAPRVVDLTSSSKQAETDSFAEALHAASIKNYQLYRIDSTRSTTISSCSSLGMLLTGGDSLPSGYVITGATLPHGNSGACILTHPDGSTHTAFFGIGVSL